MATKTLRFELFFQQDLIFDYRFNYNRFL